jgi:hypothetical protein
MPRKRTDQHPKPVTRAEFDALVARVEVLEEIEVVTTQYLTRMAKVHLAKAKGGKRKGKRHAP